MTDYWRWVCFFLLHVLFGLVWEIFYRGSLEKVPWEQQRHQHFEYDGIGNGWVLVHFATETRSDLNGCICLV